MNQMHPNPTQYKPIYQLLVLSITLPCFLCSSPIDLRYANCMQPFNCGNTSVLGDLRYPFWGINRPNYCGKSGFELECLENTPFITISTVELQVIKTNPQAHKITVVSNVFLNNICPSAVFNTKNDIGTYAYILKLNSGSLFTDSSNRFLTILYGCPSDLGQKSGWSGGYSCIINNSNVDVQFVTQAVKASHSWGCTRVVLLPISEENAQALDESTMTLPKALDEGFEMNWLSQEDDKCKSCVGSGGQCGYNWTITQFTCYCPDMPYSLECPPSKQGHFKKMILITSASFATAAGIVILGFLVFFYKRILQKCKPIPQDRNVEDCLKNYTSSVPKRYTYANVKKMTNSFKQKLGEGGYGEVYKGILHDGCVVAVKVWKQSKGDGHEFTNEVLSISRTSHVNIVPLLGFCFEGHKRALIYEFMPNGSLEKFLNNRDSNEYTLSFTDIKIHEIAKGIAKGLEYLHQGCDMRIVHFDIKPQNILLNMEFTPKISDFGLAKPFKKNESTISMSEARGTIGYIAPEVFFRSYGGVSHKSDVYSYGMMVLELVGCTKRAGGNSENSSEIYFPQWIYKKLEQESALDIGRILENVNEMKRKMILVGLWCIQTNPSNRPAMSRVVEMLEAEVELLRVPPIPSYFSPPRQHQPTEDGSATLLSSSSPYSCTVTST